MYKYTLAIAALLIVARVHYETKYREQQWWYLRYQSEFVKNPNLKRDFESNAKLSNLFRILATLMILASFVLIMEESDG